MSVSPVSVPSAFNVNVKGSRRWRQIARLASPSAGKCRLSGIAIDAGDRESCVGAAGGGSPRGRERGAPSRRRAAGRMGAAGSQVGHVRAPRPPGLLSRREWSPEKRGATDRGNRRGFAAALPSQRGSSPTKEEHFWVAGLMGGARGRGQRDLQLRPASVGFFV